ncbi:DUF3035 domain-containing protein [Geminicoccus roseus]|uniref:DUF3035 domain-containing protein n=1 Tax=Geminicoccus roseus TaxID=404900 RepID=UPI000685B541|nr:DUF3035 domain-containing protein [Geminicoccus roseus]
MRNPGTRSAGWIAAVTAAAALLAGCDTTVQEQLGFSKNSPDEFQVLRRAPLEMPASLAELPPPRPGAPPISDADPSQDARNVLLGSVATAGVAGTASAGAASTAPPGSAGTMTASAAPSGAAGAAPPGAAGTPGDLAVVGAGNSSDGSMEAVTAELSPGQQALLNQTGEIPVDPNIRQQLNQEEQDATSISNQTFLYIASWQRTDPEDQPGVVLDPVAESKRLQEAGITAPTRSMTTRVGSVPLAAPPIN